MQFKTMPLLFAASLFLNGIFISLLAMASLSKNSLISVPLPEAGYVTAAAAVSARPPGNVVFGMIEITMKPREKAFLQFSVVSSKKQAGLLINALYDPEVISVARSGSGMEITALRAGASLMQVLTNEGFKDVALVTVEE